jgi:hypothetical protein
MYKLYIYIVAEVWRKKLTFEFVHHGRKKKPLILCIMISTGYILESVNIHIYKYYIRQ